MTVDSSRPQDQGRRHRRAGRPSEATRTLLTTYQQAMRDELEAVLLELRGREPEAGLLEAELPPAKPVRPSLRDRQALWDLAIKLGRELGSEIDTAPAVPADAEPAAPARRRRLAL